MTQGQNKKLEIPFAELKSKGQKSIDSPNFTTSQSRFVGYHPTKNIYFKYLKHNQISTILKLFLSSLWNK